MLNKLTIFFLIVGVLVAVLDINFTTAVQSNADTQCPGEFVLKNYSFYINFKTYFFLISILCISRVRKLIFLMKIHYLTKFLNLHTKATAISLNLFLI